MLDPRSGTRPFVPPDYPYERLGALRAVADRAEGGVVDLSIGTPCDPPDTAVVAGLSRGLEMRGYPSSIGTEHLRAACSSWMERRFGVQVATGQIAVCMGTKELVASVPHLMKLRDPARDTVLCPELAYPTYVMGAMLAGCRPVPVRAGAGGRLDLESVTEEDAARALLVWVNSPGNPAGRLEDLDAVVAWGRERAIPVFSDECYTELTWDGPSRSALQSGTDGVVAVHSLSKRSNLAGLRAGFYAGDADLVGYLALVRRHAGAMVPGPVQEAAAVAWSDDTHVAAQKERYRRRLELLVDIARSLGAVADLPEGGIYVWARVPDVCPDGWAFASLVAEDGGALVSPGDLYGQPGERFVRLAAVQPDERIEMIVRRLEQRSTV